MILAVIDQPIWLIVLTGFKLFVELIELCYWLVARPRVFQESFGAGT